MTEENKKERALILIKPDAIARKLSGIVIYDLDHLNLKMIGLKLVSVQNHLAEKHYAVHKEKPFYNDLLKYLMGEYHNVHAIIAIAYEGENAIQKLREYAGKTNPDDAEPSTLRGRYGKVNSKTNNFDNVMHISDSPENGEKEISIWFSKEELVD